MNHKQYQTETKEQTWVCACEQCGIMFIGRKDDFNCGGCR